MVTNLKPLSSNVLVMVEDMEENSKTAGGLFIPTTAKSDKLFQTGKVMATGNLTDEVKVGDRVIFNKFAGIKIDQQLSVLKQDDILLVHVS